MVTFLPKSPCYCFKGTVSKDFFASDYFVIIFLQAPENNISCFAPVRFFIPSQAPVSRNGLMHTCRHAYFCFQGGLETLLPGKGGSCYLEMEGKPKFKSPAPLLWQPSPPPFNLIGGRGDLVPRD